MLLFSFLLFPLAAVSPCTRLGEKSSAPDDVMMGTPSRDLTLQFLPNRLEKMLVAEELLRMDCGCWVESAASDCWGSAVEAVEASGSMGVRGGVDERSLSFTFVSDALSFRLNMERILDGILSGLCDVCLGLPGGSLGSTLKSSFH